MKKTVIIMTDFFVSDFFVSSELFLDVFLGCYPINFCSYFCNFSLFVVLAFIM